MCSYINTYIHLIIKTRSFALLPFIYLFSNESEALLASKFVPVNQIERHLEHIRS